jgi:signal transduction histidine kinase
MLASDQKLNDTGLAPISLAFLALREDVLALWAQEVRARVEGARDLLSPILFNTLPVFYDNIAEALTPSYPRDNATSHTNAASAHGGERARMTPFGPDQVIQEYQIFREAIAATAPGRLALGIAEWHVIDTSINTAVVEAVRAFMLGHDDLRKRVAASLSHDMRTPLSVIATGASLVQVAPDLATARRGAERIDRNVQRLAQMVDELLDVLTDHSRVDITLDLSCFDIQELVQAVAEESNEGGLGTFEATGKPVTGYWCKAAMRRALDNLASNAQKYGDGGVVRINADETHGRLVLTVHNSGNHIPKDRHNGIFEYLQRGTDSASEVGWGIGLQFVKGVAEAHGGTAAVDSSREAGTTFIVDIPVDCRPFVAPH